MHERHAGCRLASRPKILLFAMALLATVPAYPQTTQHHPPATDSAAAPSPPAPFDAAMAEAMNRMDQGMSIRHSGDPDRDFATMMIPHHQGAIDMAKAELQFGRNSVLRRLAEAIIVEQQQEIELMRRELQRLVPPQEQQGK